jgi:hypothetical protein
MIVSKTPIELRVDDTEFFTLREVEQFEDLSGYRALLSVRVGSLGCIDHCLYFDDLPKIVTDLQKCYRRLAGVVEIKTPYEEDGLALEFGKLGSVAVSGVVNSYGDFRQRLEFGFHADQSYIPALINNLKAVLAEIDESRTSNQTDAARKG